MKNNYLIQHSDLSIPEYERLKQMILKNKLQSGEKLPPKKLTVRLGINHTRLLNALQMPEYDFLVVSIPRHGMLVNILPVDKMPYTYDVREGIDPVDVCHGNPNLFYRRILNIDI